MKINSLLNTVCLLGMTLTFALVGCKSDEEVGDEVAPTPEVEACFESGDILVSSAVNDNIVALNPDGSFKKLIYNVPISAGEGFYGMDYIESTGEVVVVVDGTDRVMAISPEDCSARMLVADANFTGTVRGITQLSTGDLLVVETNNVERFTASGTRIATGGWPRALQTGGTQVHAISTGGFVHCSTTLDVVRTYDDAGTQTATRSSGISGTTDASGCHALSSGQIVTAWSGTTDSVIFYNSNLSSATATFSNLTYLSTPGGIGELASGNILVADRALHHLVEITPAGTYVQTIGSGLLNTPEYILVIP